MNEQQEQTKLKLSQLLKERGVALEIDDVFAEITISDEKFIISSVEGYEGTSYIILRQENYEN